MAPTWRGGTLRENAFAEDPRLFNISEVVASATRKTTDFGVEGRSLFWTTLAPETASNLNLAEATTDGESARVVMTGVGARFAIAEGEAVFAIARPSQRLLRMSLADRAIVDTGHVVPQNTLFATPAMRSTHRLVATCDDTGLVLFPVDGGPPERRELKGSCIDLAIVGDRYVVVTPLPTRAGEPMITIFQKDSATASAELSLPSGVWQPTGLATDDACIYVGAIDERGRGAIFRLPMPAL